MREARYQSKCPQCGNVDIISESETTKEVHCQCCYHHYDFKIADIKRRITKDSRGISNYMHVSIEEMDWLLEQAEKVDELVSISLWSIRRLPTSSLKIHALIDLKKVVGESYKHIDFINEWLNVLTGSKVMDSPNGGINAPVTSI